MTNSTCFLILGAVVVVFLLWAMWPPNAPKSGPMPRRVKRTRSYDDDDVAELLGALKEFLVAINKYLVSQSSDNAKSLVGTTERLMYALVPFAGDM